ncbi:Transposon Ty3-G Gag-Pol polyprotein [Labeo rohita]|uniref:Transposon Ty3-G Gag-Pol polyprotein n=1 Tax=Labeo rohita TaxID=84645 RepID=A0ABQ8MS87_LABRO|nr:Transposon Ty3-G Gag-Pol polyprotein [Labeo rohita]
MKTDTGPGVIIMSQKQFQAAFSTEPLEVTSVKLKTYTGEIMLVLGQFQAKVSCDGQSESLPLIVVKGEMPLFLAPSIFQRIMENLTRVLDVVVYLDDLVVTGGTEQEHLQRLQAVLQRLQELSSVYFWMNRSSTDNMQENGLRVKIKVAAIKDAPAPTCVKDLRAFLGLVNYYDCFLPNQSTMATPLYILMRDNVPWEWKQSEQRAFEKCKDLLTN